MTREGCTGLAVWVLIILVLMALIAAGGYQLIRGQQRLSELEAEQRAAVRQQQVAIVADDVDEAAKWLERRESEMVLSTLRQMDQKLQILALAANSAGDTAEAGRIASLRQPVMDAVAAMEAAAGDEQALQAASEYLPTIRDSFASTEPPAQPAPAGPPERTSSSGPEATQRAVVRRQQLQNVAGDLDRVERFVNDRKPQYALETLQEMDQKLQLLMAAAHSQAETQRFERLNELHTSVLDAVARIGDEESDERRLVAEKNAIQPLREAFEGALSEEDQAAQ